MAGPTETLFPLSETRERLSEHWYRSHQADPVIVALYMRHYSRYRPVEKYAKRPCIVGPGEKIVLVTADGKAGWIWRRERFRRDGQMGVNCGFFRNESDELLSSVLIKEAVEIAWQRWPGERLFTFIDAEKVRSSNPGYCYRVAGWSRCGLTKRGLIIYELVPPMDQKKKIEKKVPKTP